MRSASNSSQIIKYPIVVTPINHIEFPDFREVQTARSLLFYLVRRDLKVRFQQTFIGVFWIGLQPLLQLLIFYTIFGVLVKVPTGDVPYPIFYLSGFIVWQFFTQVVNSCAYSLLGNVGIITKIYFPRLTLPLASTLGALIDFAVTFVILLIFLLANNYAITVRFLLLPLFLLLTMIFSLGVGLLFGALMVIFRDTKNLINFILQVWMFMSPILYPVTIAPEEFRPFFFINPLAGFIEAFRWMFLNSNVFPSINNLAISSVVAFILLFIGLITFRSMENRIADVM